MSAFFGIINLDGLPVERSRLDVPSSYLARIGPDGHSTFLEGQAGFCWAQLQISNIAGTDNHPFARNDSLIVVGDIRIDARKTLLAALKLRGKNGLDYASDSEIVLNAWLLWRDQLIDYMMGDFSLVIWDKYRKTLYCLRDHMGIRPFYYVQSGRQFIFSNVLNCLRLHPLVSNELNDQAVVDFLVFGFNQEFSTTIFKDIRQLGPAHLMQVSSSQARLIRYWTLPVQSVLRYRKVNEYVEHFRQLLDDAVRDRLPSEDTGIAMSGGLDSTSIAACARNLLPSEYDLSLNTLDIKSLWSDDREAEHAALTARHIKAQFNSISISKSDLFLLERPGDWLLPEPSRDAFRSPILALLTDIAAQHKVGLTGHGLDSLLIPSPGHLNKLIRSHQWRRLIVDVSRHMRIFHRRPPLYLRTLIKKRFEKSSWRPTVPPWLKPEIMIETGFFERFENHIERMFESASDAHPERPEAYMDLSSSIWPATLLRFDPQTTGMPLEFRHPYFDIRLISFVLAMPAMPWFHRKELLRRSMMGSLPDTVRLREKSMPRISPVYKCVVDFQSVDWESHLLNLDVAGRYIDRVKFGKLVMYNKSLKSDEMDYITLPVAFTYWLTLNNRR